VSLREAIFCKVGDCSPALHRTQCGASVVTHYRSLLAMKEKAIRYLPGLDMAGSADGGAGKVGGGLGCSAGGGGG